MEIKTIPLVVHEVTEERHRKTVSALVAGWSASVVALLIAFFVAKRK